MSNSKVKKTILLTLLTLPLLAGVGNYAHAIPHASRASTHIAHHTHRSSSSTVLPAMAAGALVGTALASHNNGNSQNAPIVRTDGLSITCSFKNSASFFDNEISYDKSFKRCQRVLSAIIPEAKLGEILNITSSGEGSYVTFKINK